MPLSTAATGTRCLGPVDRRDRITVEEFFAEYFMPRKPVVICGLAEDWRATQRWTFEFFREHYGSVMLRCGRCFDHFLRQPLCDYVDYILSKRSAPEAGSEPDLPLAMDGWYFRRTHPELMQDYTVPAVFANDWIDRFLPDRLNPKGTTILLGPKGTFTKLHRDLMRTHGWNTQLRGRKRWLLVDPVYTPDAYIETRQSSGYFPGTDIDAPDLDRYPNLDRIRYTETILEPGDTIFFPAGWLHQVNALEDSISLHHNYISANNFLGAFSAYAQFCLMHRKI